MDIATLEGVNRILSDMAEAEYKAFVLRLTNTKYPVLGIRIPKLQSLAKQITKGDFNAFLAIPFTFFEHHLLRGMVIALCKEEEAEHLALFDEYLRYVDDWEGVDLIATRYDCKTESYFSSLRSRLFSDGEFSARFALVALLHNFASNPAFTEPILLDVRALTECGYLRKFSLSADGAPLDITHSASATSSVPHSRLGGYLPPNLIPETQTEPPSPGYYVMMGAAWLLSVLYLTDKNAVISYIKDPRIDKNTRLKTISKILDSFRVPSEEKRALRLIRDEIKKSLQ